MNTTGRCAVFGSALSGGRLRSHPCRHHDVEEHHVALATPADLQRGRSVHGGQHGKVLGGQPRFEQLHIGKDVVDNKKRPTWVRPLRGNFFTVSMNFATEMGLDR